VIVHMRLKRSHLPAKMLGDPDERDLLVYLPKHLERRHWSDRAGSPVRSRTALDGLGAVANEAH
jgi:hypothetical protein